jgi:FKBP-type peptidyl-prolyl cis-trans isomerase FklB
MHRASSLSLLLLAASGVHAGTNSFGKQFLEKQKAEPGVVTLPSGLQYRVLREGDGEAHPLRDTQCSCHYEGRTAQEYSKSPKGKKFDSSYDRGSPTSFAPSGVIAGWTEAMQLMVEGDKWEMFIPSELGYGDSGQGGDIGAGDVLVFTMELLKIEGPSSPAEPKGPPPYTELVTPADLAAWIDAQVGPAPAMVLATLRQPTKGSKLFQAVKAAARASAKAEGKDAFAIAANSKFEKGKYTVDPVAAALKLESQAVYVSTRTEHWKRCKTGRPSEATVDQMKDAISRCVADATGGKAEL